MPLGKWEMVPDATPADECAAVEAGVWFCVFPGHWHDSPMSGGNSEDDPPTQLATAFLAREGLDGSSLIKWMTMTPEEFSACFKGSPIKRAKRRGLLRNVGEWRTRGPAVPAEYRPEHGARPGLRRSERVRTRQLSDAGARPPRRPGYALHPGDAIAPICTPTRVGLMTGRYQAWQPVGLREPSRSWLRDRSGQGESTHPTAVPCFRRETPQAARCSPRPGDPAM